MAWMIDPPRGGVATAPRRRVEEVQPYEPEIRVETRRERLARWGREHKLVVTLAAVALFLLSLAVAFEAGHAYAEGVRTLGGFAEHLSGMVHHFTGGRFGTMPTEHPLGGWLWLLPKGWLW